jgi:hypothetical protein
MQAAQTTGPNQTSLARDAFKALRGAWNSGIVWQRPQRGEHSCGTPYGSVGPRNILIVTASLYSCNKILN